MVAMKLMTLDTLFHSVKTDKVILNDYNVTSTKEIEELKSKLSTIYTSDTISLLPRCSCGELEGEFFRNMTCDICDTKALGIYDSTDPFIWFRALDNTEKFISPEFWNMVKKALGGNIDFLRWISDKQYNPPISSATSKKILNAIKIVPGFERSYVWLVKNMQKLLVSLAATLNKSEIYDIIELFKKQKKHVFSTYLPLQNKRMFILEETVKNKYTNLSILDVLDIVLFFIRNANSNSQNKREQVMGRTCHDLAKIFEESIRTYLSSKPGIPRKHINGFRSYFTCRAVIVPIVDKHKYDEVRLPWSVVVVMMRPHILNKLLKRGYSYVAANNILYGSVEHYSELVDNILEEMIDESYHKSFPITINRNPSLLTGSTQAVRGLYKKDPADKTISISILIAKNPNA